MAGVSGVEQLHFARTLLFPAIYHHQKVRALECTIRGIFEAVAEAPHAVPEHMRFGSVGDFLGGSEYDFFALSRVDSADVGKVRDLLDRRVLRRALHVSQRSLTEEGRRGLAGFMQLAGIDPEAPKNLTELRDEIFGALPPAAKTSRESLWVDVPTPRPASKDILRCNVVAADGSRTLLTDVFPIDRWLNTYGENKWTAHVFYEPEDDRRLAASRAAKDVLGARFGLQLKDEAYTLAKVEPPR